MAFTKQNAKSYWLNVSSEYIITDFMLTKQANDKNLQIVAYIVHYIS